MCLLDEDCKTAKLTQIILFLKLYTFIVFSLNLVNNTLYYVHDPMCSWRWALQINGTLKGIDINYLDANYIVKQIIP